GRRPAGSLGQTLPNQSAAPCLLESTLWSPDQLRDTLPNLRGQHDDSLPSLNGLSEIRSGLVLELYGSLRTRRREVSGGATRADHRRRHAAEALGYSSRQP